MSDVVNRKLPVNMGVPVDEFKAALKEVSGFGIARLKNDIDSTQAFLEKASEEAHKDGKFDLNNCTEINGTEAERELIYGNAHAYLSAMKDTYAERLEQEVIRNRNVAGMISQGHETPYASFMNQFEAGANAEDAIMNGKKTKLEVDDSYLFSRVDNGLQRMQNALSTTSTMAQTGVRGDLEVTQLLPYNYLYDQFRMVQAMQGESALILPITTTVTNAAAVTAEGADAPEGTLVVEESTFALKHIATQIPVTEQALRQRVYTQELMNYEMPVMIQEALDTEVWSVIDGLTGIGTEDIAYASGKPTAGMDGVKKAITKVYTGSRMPATLVALEPTVFDDFVLAEKGSNNYHINPLMDMVPRIWGVRTITPLRLFTAFGAANNKLGVVAHTNRFSFWWVQGGIEMERGHVADQFKQYELTIRAGIYAVFVNTQPKAYVRLDQG